MFLDENAYEKYFWYICEEYLGWLNLFTLGHFILYIFGLLGIFDASAIWIMVS